MLNNRKVTRAGRFSGSFRQWLYPIVFGTFENYSNQISKHLLCLRLYFHNSANGRGSTTICCARRFSSLTKLIRCLLLPQNTKNAIRPQTQLDISYLRVMTNFFEISLFSACSGLGPPSLPSKALPQEKREICKRALQLTTAKITTTTTKRNK